MGSMAGLSGFASRNKGGVAVIAGLTLLVGAGGALAAASATSGNPSGIALAHAQQRAYSKVAGYSYTQTGFVSMRDQEGRTSFFSWSWGTGLVPHGWARATEHGFLALRHGIAQWWRDDLTPPPCRRAGICNEIPVEIVAERSGRFFAFGDARNHTCYGHLNGGIPIAIGKPAIAVVGDYRAPVPRGATELLTYSYPWLGRPHELATETDVISRSSLLTESGHVRVPRGSRQGEPAFTFSFSDSSPQPAQPAPRINLCRG